MGMLGTALLCVIAVLVLTPIADHSASDDSPSTIALILLVLAAALAVVISGLLWLSLLVGSIVV